ncbi:putative translation initiation factor aIF-2 [Necator americanus]|uniref:Eukaryotic translation initiation factor 5B n=1 Tax=Necator americanus TaxID=51031 RepID=W2TI18_NECAM|nr:putative translation initiation factor aIF-2 [Necator americanus]ETN80796.1 putative translation initiation factor aIF-2 [Necator americanus]
MPPKKGGGKKSKNDEWDDEAAERKLASLMAKKEDEEIDWDAESDDEPVQPIKPTAGKKTAFAMLMDDDNDDDDSDAKSHSDAEEVEKVEDKKPQKQEKKTEKKVDGPAQTKQDKKKGKKGKKGKQEDDDDLDAILANLEMSEKSAPAGKTKKKGGKKDEPESAVTVEGSKGGTPASTESAPVGSAPVVDVPETTEVAGDEGKKKKKKKKDKKKGEVEDEQEKEEKEEEAKEEVKEQAGGDAEEGEDEDDVVKDKKKKKKDKKKDKKKADKEEKDEGKGKKKKHVDMIKELLRAKQEAEEAELRRQKEEEERLEAIAKAKEEEERLAKERREAKKAKEKAAIERKKAEGTYLTAAQKEKQRIAAAKLAAAGLAKPAPTAVSDQVIYANLDRRAKKKLQEQRMKEQQLREQKEKEEAAAKLAKEAETPPPSKEETPESKSPTPAKEELLDDWEMAEEETNKTVEESEKTEMKPASRVVTATSDEKSLTAKSEESEEESSEEESESDEESESEEESSSDDESPKAKITKEEQMDLVRQRLAKRRELAESKRSTDNLRAPVICVLGHVDTGKTKMLDTIRRTNVQDGEAGGITQQIGATQVPADAIKERCKQVRDFTPELVKIPGFLIIDTPGHESFSNLRSRGSSLCDFAILVVDIMHGLEPQTIESLKLLLKRKTPFVVALNKIDRLYGYESNPRKDVYQHMKSQPQNTQLEFKERYEKIVGEFAEQAINVCLSNQNKNVDEYVSMVPTSAYLGDGIGNLMAFIVATTQKYYAEKLSFCEELDATVMEVKAIPGLGTTIDVILVNGRLKVGDIIVITGTDGAIMTPIRELLMPQPLKELRVKNEYGHYKEIQGAQGVKVLAKGLEKALAGLPLFVAHKVDEIDFLKQEAEAQLSQALMSIKKKREGVYVQASTLGSLEALLEFLKTQKIPYSNVNIGPVHKKDVQKAAAMLEHKPEFACILAFDVKIERDAQLYADQEKVKIFQADIIYHLEDNFLKYREELRLKARRENEHLAIFPCKLRVLPQHVFNARNPIVCGVSVEAGQLKRGTPICVPSKDCIFLGSVASIERNHEEIQLAKAGDEVCIKIENTTGEAPKLYGRHFNHEDPLVSRISRDSIDACKTYFRDDLTRADWQLVVELKRLLDIH